MNANDIHWHTFLFRFSSSPTGYQLHVTPLGWIILAVFVGCVAAASFKRR